MTTSRPVPSTTQRMRPHASSRSSGFALTRCASAKCSASIDSYWPLSKCARVARYSTTSAISPKSASLSRSREYSRSASGSACASAARITSSSRSGPEEARRASRGGSYFRLRLPSGRRMQAALVGTLRSKIRPCLCRALLNARAIGRHSSTDNLQTGLRRSKQPSFWLSYKTTDGRAKLGSVRNWNGGGIILEAVRCVAGRLLR